MKIKSLLVAAVGMVMSLSLHATPIFTQTTIIDDTSILGDGNLVVANNLGRARVGLSINGVVFGTDQSAFNSSWSNGSGSFSYDVGFSANLDKLLDELVYANNFNALGFSVSGLTAGNAYRLQLLFSNDKNTTGNDVNVSLLGSSFHLTNWQPGAINLIVSFVALSDTLNISFDGPDTTEGRAVLNGYALHDVTDVPAPASILLLSIGLLGLARTRRAQK